jgi:DNA-binding LacI/PurR family transcriptional regulator
MIPYLRNDGNIYSNIIKNLRDKLAPEKYLYLVANQEFQKIKETKFENFVSSNGYEYYICDYYNQQKYKDKLTESFIPYPKCYKLNNF